MTILDESRLARLGIRLDWGLGENLYRGPDEFGKGLLNTLRILSNYHEYGMTDFARPEPRRYFPPNSNINEWIENDFTYPAPNVEIRTVVGGLVLVIDPNAVPTVAFPSQPPADPEDPDDPNQPDPEVFTSGHEEGKWRYDPVEWEVIGKVLFGTPAPTGMLIFSRVDNAWQFWDGSAWRVAARHFERSFEISASYPKKFVGGRLFNYCAVESFRLPKGMAGSTGSGLVRAPTTMQVMRNNDPVGSLVFMPDPGWRAIFSSSADVNFGPGDRLSVYTEEATNGLSEAAVTIRGIYN